MSRKRGELVVMESLLIVFFVRTNTLPYMLALILRRHTDFSWKDLNRHFWMIEKSREEMSLTAEDEQRQKNEARAVAQYAANREDCRRVLILTQFRETYSQSRCKDSCDNCLEHHDASLQDMSAEAVNILRLLEGAHKSNTNITENELVAAFKGRSVKSVKNKGLERLPCSGAGSSIDQAIIERIVSYLGREDGLTHFEQVTGPGGWNSTYLKLGPEANAFIKGNLRVVLHVKPPTTSKAKGKDKPIQRTKKTRKSIRHNEQHEVTEVETIVVKKSKSVRRSSSKGERIVFTDDEDDIVHSDVDRDRDEIEDSEAGPSASRGGYDHVVEPFEDDQDGSSKRCFRRLTSLRDHVSA
jgi:bloom syndrome protein